MITVDAFLRSIVRGKRTDIKYRLDYETINKVFDTKLKALTEYHQIRLEFPDSIALDITTVVRLPKNKKELIKYARSLLDFYEIGRRNKWIDVHVDRQGSTAYLVINKKHFRFVEIEKYLFIEGEHIES